MKNNIMKIIQICALRVPAFAYVLILMISCIASGCSKSVTTKKTEVSATGFRADPSKMTAEEKEKFDSLMRSSQTPAKKNP